MRIRTLGVGAALGTAAIATAVFMGPSAYASGGGGGGGGRPCGPTHMASGNGSLGTPWTLKSKYDDDGAQPGVVVGEEFQIKTQIAGQQWHVQLADNGLVFFDKVLPSATAGITAMSNTPDQGGVDQHMTATATNLQTGEVIDNAEITLPGPPPPGCGLGAG